MSIPCNEAHERAELEPLGTVLECGCTIRALSITCQTCWAQQWVFAPTDVPVWGLLELAGYCTYCKAPMDQWVTVRDTIE